MPSPWAWIGIGAFALIAFFISGEFFPAFVLAVLFVVLILGIVVLAPQFAATTPGVVVIILIIIAIVIFGFLQVGQSVSLSLVQGL
ncbi:MAG: hypothetical protein WCB19_05705 [Thermoplasmata archaeon]